jgi:hypothetical protein
MSYDPRSQKSSAEEVFQDVQVAALILLYRRAEDHLVEEILVD